jgi:hypothetical protein
MEALGQTAVLRFYNRFTPTKMIPAPSAPLRSHTWITAGAGIADFTVLDPIVSITTFAGVARLTVVGYHLISLESAGNPFDSPEQYQKAGPEQDSPCL